VERDSTQKFLTREGEVDNKKAGSAPTLERGKPGKRREIGTGLVSQGSSRGRLPPERSAGNSLGEVFTKKRRILSSKKKGGKISKEWAELK